MANTFAGKNFFIIGATGGIGNTLAQALHDLGAKLFLVGRDQDKLAPLAQEFGAEYDIIESSDFEALGKSADQALAEMGPFQGLVNCAGSLLLKPAHNTSHEEFTDTLKANVFTAFALVRQAPKLLTQGGSVVLMSSVAAQVGLVNHEAIATAKAGIIGLTRSAAATYAKDQIRVNAIAPSLVTTPLTQSLTNNDLARKASEAMHPLGRIGTTQDILKAFLFLLDPENTWITGEVLSVDGGLSHIYTRKTSR